MIYILIQSHIDVRVKDYSNEVIRIKDVNCVHKRYPA